MTTSSAGPWVAWHVRVTGVVQGVGFRPFVHRLALRHHLEGWVRNASGEVEIALEGPNAELEAFLRELQSEAPPLARIDDVTVEPAMAVGSEAFVIRASADAPDRRLPVPPDVATCAACERELFDPADRRSRYPFITCTDCGPRYTVIRAMPYDRERTTMEPFRQCPACRAEYLRVDDRRHHSETNSCPVCGPRLWFTSGGPDRRPGSEAALGAAEALLREGRILALRGLGGFQLAVNATDDRAVMRLRSRKGREAKPFAVMVRTVEEVRALAELSPASEALLTSPERPIVLLPRRPYTRLAPAVAPGLDVVGVMLATTPVHHLLLDDCRFPLVMTSGNRSEEPIAIANDEALLALSDVADGFLLHDREITARVDDSVTRVVAGRPLLLRRARGYAPIPVPLPVAAPVPLVAVGPHLKNTFTLAEGRRAWVSPHLGDLEGLETIEHFRTTLAHYRRLLRTDPVVAVRDGHEGYLSTRLAEELDAERILVVQHHHAHIAAVAAEHGITGPVLGIAMDGTGAGDDGTVWGAEFLVADLRSYTRVGHFRSAPLPGGDLAARLPWRSALGYLSLAPEGAAAFAEAFAGVTPTELTVAQRQVDRRLNAPLVSSMGRLFDAASAILGLRRHASFEGQAAMELEALAANGAGAVIPCPMTEQGDRLVIDPLPLLAALGYALRTGADTRRLAADFHESIAAATATAAERLALTKGLDTVVLGGGCFQNARLLERVTRLLADRGLRVLWPRLLPPNDGAISYGQAAVAAARLAAE
ncbi:MAG TPA: carbamoyltransferase HypF [Gemmatimonadales bacterium]|nr:carbamoyltransferase HypF [Gemmatimonadales bacterium]